MKSAEDKKLEALLAEIELPDGAYDKAVARYEDLGAWLNRDGSSVKSYNPHISPQGSFALGTAIYPLNRNEHYDLGSRPAEWCTSRESWSGWTRAQLTTADSRAG
jgi:hypothetical protein